MARSKKDGRHGGGHKLHWGHYSKSRGKLAQDAYCYMDCAGTHCHGNCPLYHKCASQGITRSKARKSKLEGSKDCDGKF